MITQGERVLNPVQGNLNIRSFSKVWKGKQDAKTGNPIKQDYKMREFECKRFHKLIDRIENSNEQQEVLYDDLYFLYRKDGYALVGSTYKGNPDGTSSFGAYISSTCKEVGELVTFLRKAWQPELASGLEQDVYYRTAFELVENHASSSNT